MGDATTTTVEQQPRFAVTSSLWSDHLRYTRYAVALGYSMAQSNGDYFKAVGVDMILLTYSDIKFSLKSVREIEAVGWKMRQVPRISPTPSTPDMFRENFGRINIWAWTEYSRIVYIDADAIVMRDISALFLLAPGVTGVVGDVWPDRLDSEHFNAGVLSLEPTMDDFVEMIAAYRNYTVYEYEGSAEQGLLNWYFKHRMTILPRIYNFNLELCESHKAMWDKFKGDARIIHFTRHKPGTSRAEDMHNFNNTQTLEPMTWWWDNYEEAREWNTTYAK